MTGSWEVQGQRNIFVLSQNTVKQRETDPQYSMGTQQAHSTWALVVTLHRFFCVKTKRMKWFLNLVGLVALLPPPSILSAGWSRVSDRYGFIITNHFPVCAYLFREACVYLAYVRCHCDIDYRFFKPTKCFASYYETQNPPPHVL